MKIFKKKIWSKFSKKYALKYFVRLYGVFLTLAPHYWDFRLKCCIFDLNNPFSTFSAKMGHFRPQHPIFRVFALNEVF